MSCKAFLTWGKIWGRLCRGEDRHKSKKPYTSTLWGGIPGRLIPVNPYQPTIHLCLLPGTEDALRSHHECCLPASQRCHIDFHVYFNNGLWICFSIFLVTWPHCDVSIPCAFTPGKPICEDFCFIKSPPPNLISTIWSQNGKASPEGKYLWPKTNYRKTAEVSSKRSVCFQARPRQGSTHSHLPPPLAAGMSQRGREVTENRIT